MKLPGPTYQRGQSSFGRDPTDPTQVSRAQFAVAQAETGVGTAEANMGEAIARAGAQEANTGSIMVRTGSIMAEKMTAQGQIAQALKQTADVFDTWDKAGDAVRANEGLARYADGTSKLMDSIKTQPTVKAANLPDGWIKPDDTREDIPTWEVSQKLWDEGERALYKDAMSKVTRVEHRAELDKMLVEKRVAGASQVRNHYISEQKKDWTGRNEEAIKTLVQGGDPKGAVNVVENGFKIGMYNAVERIQKITKIWHDDEDLRTAQRLGDTSNVGGLRVFYEEVLYKKDSRLSPDERRAYANSAMTKIEHITKQEEIDRNRKERDDSKRVMGDLATRIRLDNYIPTRKELEEARKVMVPADYLALVALVDRKDGNGDTKSDPATLRELNLQIIGLGKADASGMPNHLRADSVMDGIMLGYANQKIGTKDREQLVLMLERYRDRAIRKSPEHTMADEMIDSSLLPPRTMLSQMSMADATRHGALSTQMKLELNDATRKDPRLDPIKWTNDNMPRYKELSTSLSYERLFAMGLGPYAKPGPAGKFDTTTTRAALDEGKRLGRIPDDLYKRAIDELSKIKPAMPDKGKEVSR